MENKDNKLKKFLSKFKTAKIKVDPKIAERIEDQGIGKITIEDNKTFVYIDNRKDIKILAPDNEAYDDLLNLFFNKHVSWVKETIAGENSLVLDYIKRPKEIIKEIRSYISGEDYGALSFAYAIMKKEDKKIDTLEMDKQLIVAYGSRGKRIYSLLRSGVLANEIWPLIKDMEKQKIKDKFDEIVKSPPSVFVGVWMSKSDVIKEINKKIFEGHSDFPIFARAGKVKTAINAIEEMQEKDEYIVYHVEKDEPIGKDDAVTIHFFKLDKI